MKKYTDHTWDYAAVDTKYYTHGIHSYPAMMIPQVARRLIEENSKNAKTALDPFCGSGSVLLEFKLAGINSYGVDINPLAVMISRAKTTLIDPIKLRKTWNKLQGTIGENTLNPTLETPNFFNINYWFKKDVIFRLSVIKKAIEGIDNKKIREFFLVCFSDTVRKSSNSRGSEFKLYRISESRLKEYNPEPFKIFSGIVIRNIAGMSSLYDFSKKIPMGSVEVILADITEKTKIASNSVDLVVTSPPYGDSRTTVAYGQFSRLSLQWLDFPDNLVKEMDKVMLGGRPAPNLEFKFNSPSLEETVHKISQEDNLRARDVVSFFMDFHEGAKEIDRVMKDSSTICIVIGNRTVKKIKIPTDAIISEIFEEFGYHHIKTVVRRIPSKRMPKINSPTNVKGKTLSTINEENIVILRK